MAAKVAGVELIPSPIPSTNSGVLSCNSWASLTLVQISDGCTEEATGFGAAEGAESYLSMALASELTKTCAEWHHL